MNTLNLSSAQTEWLEDYGYSDKMASTILLIETGNGDMTPWEGYGIPYPEGTALKNFRAAFHSHLVVEPLELVEPDIPSAVPPAVALQIAQNDWLESQGFSKSMAGTMVHIEALQIAICKAKDPSQLIWLNRELNRLENHWEGYGFPYPKSEDLVIQFRKLYFKEMENCSFPSPIEAREILAKEEDAGEHAGEEVDYKERLKGLTPEQTLLLQSYIAATILPRMEEGYGREFLLALIRTDKENKKSLNEHGIADAEIKGLLSAVKGDIVDYARTIIAINDTVETLNGVDNKIPSTKMDQLILVLGIKKYSSMSGHNAQVLKDAKRDLNAMGGNIKDIDKVYTTLLKDKVDMLVGVMAGIANEQENPKPGFKAPGQ